MQGNVRIYPDTRYRAFDFATASGIRCVGLGFDGLELGIALGDDAEVIAAVDTLVEELDKLRQAAMVRAEGREVVAEWTRGTA